ALGTAEGRLFGSSRRVSRYFHSHVSGGLRGSAFSPPVARGVPGDGAGFASSVVRLVGIHKQLFYETMGKSVIFILLINLVFGFLVPQIDMGAHVGGLIGGFIAAAITSLPYQKHSVKLHKVLGVISFLIMIVFLVGYGLMIHDVS